MNIYKKEIITIPNLLSMFRLVLAGMILFVNFQENIQNKWIWMILLILCSGFTDILDGYIARHFDMVSEVGKILDPVADKITQLILLVCVMHRSKWMKMVTILFVVKEVFQGIVGWITIRIAKKNEGAKWYGKACTVVIYTIMCLMILFPNMTDRMVTAFICVMVIFMLNALVLYTRQFWKILHQNS